MKLIDIVDSGRQVTRIPKSEIPALLGEVETLKARLWLRLTEWEEIEHRAVLARAPSEQPQRAADRPRAILKDQALKPEIRILREKEVVKLTGLCRSTLWCLQREGRFPKGRKIGLRSIGWLNSEVLDWINERFRNKG